MNGTRRPDHAAQRPGAFGREWRLGFYLHRHSGPAVELADGFKEWHFKGRIMSWQPGLWSTSDESNELMRRLSKNITGCPGYGG